MTVIKKNYLFIFKDGIKQPMLEPPCQGTILRNKTFLLPTLEVCFVDTRYPVAHKFT